MKKLLKWGCVGTSAVVGLVVVLAIAVVLFSNKEQAFSPSITSEVVASQPIITSEQQTITPAIEAVSTHEPTLSPTEPPTSLPSAPAAIRTPTLVSQLHTPEKTEVPPIETIPVSTSDLIVYVPNILGKSVQEIEDQYGQGAMITQMPAGAVDSIPEGGEMRTYTVGKYSFSVAYNLNGVAKGFQVMDGLSEDDYLLNQWSLLLNRFGFSVTESPDMQAPMAVRWDNFHGYKIEIATSTPDGPVWTVKISKLRDEGEKPIAQQKSEPGARPYVQVKEGVVNIRQGPDTSFPIVGKMREGDHHAIIGKTLDQRWWQICCVNENPAWVAAWVVEATGDVGLVPVVQEITSTATSTLTLTPSIIKPKPTPTYLAPPVHEILATWRDESLTDVQRDAYLNSLKGKRAVNWSGRVTNVDKTLFFFYTVEVDVTGDSDYDVIFPVSKEEALRINKGQHIVFSGTISSFSSFLGLSHTIHLSNVTFRLVEALDLTQPLPGPYVQIKESPVNIRQGPGTSFPIIGKMVEGSRYEIIGKTLDEKWWQICCVNDKPAWVAAWVVEAVGNTEQIAVVQEIPTPPPTPTPKPQMNLAEAFPGIGETVTANGWEFKIYDVKKRKAVYFYDEAYIAQGHFLLVFIEAVNRKPGTASFGDLDPYVADLTGKEYEYSSKGSWYAQWQYEGLSSYYDDVNPGNLIRIVHAYDLPDTVGDVTFGVNTGQKIYLGNFSAMPSEDS